MQKKMKGDYTEKFWQTFHSRIFRRTGGQGLSDHTSYSVLIEMFTKQKFVSLKNVSSVELEYLQ